jgi:hypothetical protein
LNAGKVVLSMTRRVYVCYPDFIASEKRQGERECILQYYAEPCWIFDDRPSAEYECGELCKGKVEVESHFCEFAVETLEDGKFTIICMAHPSHLKLATPLSQ